MCQSQRKMDVRITTHAFNGQPKRWVRVTLKRSPQFFPSFRDIGRMVVAIGVCEERAYPNGRGAALMLDYLRDAMQEAKRVGAGVNWDALDRKYQIPNRGCTQEAVERQDRMGDPGPPPGRL